MTIVTIVAATAVATTIIASLTGDITAGN
jgi:hypothetical protein